MTKPLTQTLLALAIFSSACGTIAHGTGQRVPVVSTPAGATVTADCGLGPRVVGETPLVVKVNRKADRCVINIQKEGYEQDSVVLTRHLSGWFWGNILLPYALPEIVVDLFDGGAFNKTPAAVRVNLAAKDDWRSREGSADR